MAEFACPYCDTFAFDDPQGLVDHLAEAHTPGASVPAPATAAPAYVPPAPAPAPPAARSVPNNPPTDKQLNYLRTLLDQHPGEYVDLSMLTRATASAEIDRLRNLPTNGNGSSRPFVPRPAPQPQYQPDPFASQYGGASPTDVPVGLHSRDGIVYRVSRSKAGNLYVKVLELSPRGRGGQWVYKGVQPLSLLSVETLTTNEAAA